MQESGRIRTETVDALGYRIVMYREGDPARPRVLLAHGWNSYGLRYRTWIDRLVAAGYHVITFDQPAHGLSSGSEASLVEFTGVLRDLVRHVGTTYAVIAHSLAATSLPFAITPAWTPTKAVLIAPLSDPRAAAARMFAQFGLSSAAFKAFEAVLTKRGNGTFDDYRPQSVASTMATDALFIHDLDDAVTPWEEGRSFATSWPGAEYLSTNGLGHFRLLDDEHVIRKTIDFISAPAHVSCVGQVTGSPP